MIYIKDNHYQVIKYPCNTHVQDPITQQTRMLTHKNIVKISVLDINHQYQGSLESVKYCGSNLLHKLLDTDLPTDHMMTYNYTPFNMVCGGRTNYDFSQINTKKHTKTQ